MGRSTIQNWSKYSAEAIDLKSKEKITNNTNRSTAASRMVKSADADLIKNTDFNYICLHIDEKHHSQIIYSMRSGNKSSSVIKTNNSCILI